VTDAPVYARSTPPDHPPRHHVAGPGARVIRSLGGSEEGGTMRRTTVIAGVVAAWLLGAATALGHTELRSVRPADGATLAAPPPALVATYGEPMVRVEEAVIASPGAAERRVAARLSRRDRSVVLVPLDGAITPGHHTVRWVVTGGDGHALAGEASFTLRPPTVTAELRRVGDLLTGAAAALRGLAG
jgi:methionine-rich copper-binding protein CopC